MYSSFIVITILQGDTNLPPPTFLQNLANIAAVRSFKFAQKHSEQILS